MPGTAPDQSAVMMIMRTAAGILIAGSSSSSISISSGGDGRGMLLLVLVSSPDEHW